MLITIFLPFGSYSSSWMIPNEDHWITSIIQFLPYLFWNILIAKGAKDLEIRHTYGFLPDQASSGVISCKLLVGLLFRIKQDVDTTPPQKYLGNFLTFNIFLPMFMIVMFLLSITYCVGVYWEQLLHKASILHHNISKSHVKYIHLHYLSLSP